MFEMFDEVFGLVMDMFGFKMGWALFDSDLFEDVVEVKVAERLGVSVEELEEMEEWCEWCHELAMDL